MLAKRLNKAMGPWPHCDKEVRSNVYFLMVLNLFSVFWRFLSAVKRNNRVLDNDEFILFLIPSECQEKGLSIQWGRGPKVSRENHES